MPDLSGKTFMAIGETDDPNAIIESFATGAAVTKGDPVYLSADDVISPAAAAQDCIGIALQTVASGGVCSVLLQGRVKVAVGGAVTRGKAVFGADSSRRVLALADINEAGSATISWTRQLGWALQSATTAGDLIFIFVEK